MKKIYLILISALCGLLAVAVSSSLGDNNLGARVLLGYCLSLFVFILLDSMLDQSASILMVVVSFYHIAMFLFPGMLHCAQGWFPFFEASYSANVVSYVSQLLALYASCVTAGYVMAGWRKRARPAKKTAQNKEIGEVQIILLSVLTIGVSLGCMGAIGFSVFLLRRADFDLVGTDPTPAFLMLTSLPRAASLCAVLIVAERALASRSIFMLILFIPLFFLALLANNPLALARFQLFGAVFIVIFTSKLTLRVQYKALFVGALMVGQMIALPLIDAIARGADGSEFTFDPLRYLSEHGDFDGLQSTLNTYLMVEQKGLSYGWQFLSAILTFVPRSIWPDKAYATGQAAGEAMGFVFTNLSAPLPAEIYVDFGVPGLILIPFCFGYGGRSLDFAAQQVALAKSSIIVRLFYGGLIGYAVILCRGSLLAVMAPIYLYFGTLGLWSALSRRRRKFTPKSFAPGHLFPKAAAIRGTSR